jgi:hypothetical protein
MKSNWLSKIVRSPAVAALALVFATVTVSTAATSKMVKRQPVKRGQVHFEYVVPEGAQRDGGWYKPARSPQFSSFLH